MGLAEIVASAGKIDPPGDDAKDVIGRAPRGRDCLLIVFDERAVELELGDELIAYAGEKPVARQAELSRSRLWFG